MTIKPAKNILLCKTDESFGASSSGFQLTKEATMNPQIAEVLDVGEGVENYKIGDRVVYKSYTTSDIKLEGVDYFLVYQEDLLGTIV